jgi:rhomboid protease GluP
MAVGLTPNYSKEIPLDGLAPTQFLALCVITARALGWHIRHISDAGLVAFTANRTFKVKQRVVIRISGDTANLRSESTNGAMMDWGRNRKAADQFTELLTEDKNNHTPEQLDQTYEELKPDLVPAEEDFLTRPPVMEEKRGFFSLFVPREGYRVTPILVDINIAVFVLMLASGADFMQPSVQSLIDCGANLRALTLGGQSWRIITNFFIHIGFLHLAFNMYALLYIGVLLERHLGTSRFLVAYLLTGIMASVSSLYWHPNTISAGASGAIFGMYGVFLALLTTNLIEKTQRAALMTSIAIFVAYNLLNGTKGGIDNAAHVGGLVSGLLIGYLYYPGLKNPGKPSLSSVAITSAIVLVGAVTVIAFQTIPNDYAVFQRKMKDFSRLENQAISVVNPANGLSGADQAEAIRKTGIPDWEKSIFLLGQAKQLDVGDPLKTRTDELIRYCHLRILSYNCIYNRLTDTASSSGEDSLEYYNTQIKDLLDRFKGGK